MYFHSGSDLFCSLMTVWDYKYIQCFVNLPNKVPTYYLWKVGIEVGKYIKDIRFLYAAFEPVLLIGNITKGYITKGYILKGYIAKGYIIKGYITKGYITKGYNFKRLHNKRLHF